MSIANCYNPSIFVAGLPIDISAGKVRELFEGVHIETAYTQILRRNKGMSLKFASALIRLADVADTEAAIKALHNVEVEGHPITVRKFLPKSNRPVRACFHSPINKVWTAHVAGETESEAVAQ